VRGQRAALPDGRIRCGVVPLHPAGDPSGDQPFMRHLAGLLPAHGVAVLRYDRRRAERGRDVPLAKQADDARVAMEELRRLSGNPLLPVGLWGFSQGAWAAMLAAREGAAFLVSVSGSGVGPAHQMRYGTQQQLVRAGHGKRALEELGDLRRAYEDYLRGARGRDEVQPLVDDATERSWFELAWVPRELPEPGSWPDMDFDPLEAFARVSCPVLAFFGEDDQWVPVDRSIDGFRSVATRIGLAMSVTRLPGTTHEPVLASGPISPLYEATLVDWIRGQTP
jgi:uncharacterized protein